MQSGCQPGKTQGALKNWKLPKKSFNMQKISWKRSGGPRSSIKGCVCFAGWTLHSLKQCLKDFNGLETVSGNRFLVTHPIGSYDLYIVYIASGPLPVTVEKSIFYILTLPKWAPENTPKIHYQFEPWKHNFDTAIFMGPSLDCCECFVAMKRPKPFLRQRGSPNPNKHQTNTHTEPLQPASPKPKSQHNSHRNHKHTHTHQPKQPRPHTHTEIQQPTAQARPITATENQNQSIGQSQHSHTSTPATFPQQKLKFLPSAS